MKVRRIVIGTVVGTILSFMWINLSWTVLGLHEASIKKFPDPATVSAALKAQNVETGIFVLPHMSADYDDEEAMAAHMQEMTEGPYMMGVVRSGSLDKEPGMGAFIARGVLIQLAAVLIAAILLAAAAPNLNFAGRFMFVVMLGLFAGVTGHLPNWNWWWYPVDFTVMGIVDSVVSWTLAALAMAAIIKPTAGASSTPEPAGAIAKAA